MAVSGHVVRVNGPLAEIEGLQHIRMQELVAIGEGATPAEIVAVDGELATAQAYESLSGVRVGAAAEPLGYALSALLGPHLLGGIFDGLLRPLSDRTDWLSARSVKEAREQTFAFSPRAKVGENVHPGALLGTVATAQLEQRILVPPGISGPITSISPAASLSSDAVIALVGKHEVPLTQRWPIRIARPTSRRLDLSEPLITGQRVLDLLFPVAKGGTAAVPGGFGTGKTVLLQQLVKWSNADVIVFVGCGERGNELADAMNDLRDLRDPKTGRSLSERTIVVANTSNMPVMAREASIYTGMTVAEYFRDMGYDAVLLADSTSRWAEALREFASRSGELPAEEGYPAGLASALAAFYERAGHVKTLDGTEGSVTVIGAVSPPGGDMTEPVTAHTERFVRCLWSLDRDLAYARHYPAVTWQRSFSRDVEAIGTWHASNGRPSWGRTRSRALAILAEADRLASVVELVGLTGLPARERMTLLAGRLLREGVLQQSALSPNDATCGLAKQSALLDVVLTVYDRSLALVNGDAPASAIEELDLSRIARLKDETASDDAPSVEAAAREIIAILDRVA